MQVKVKADASQKHEYDINNLLFQSGNLYSGADDGKIKVWDKNLKLLQQVQAHPCSIFSLAASEDTIYSCSNDGTVKSWNLTNLQPKQTILQEEDKEFWKLFYENEVLYTGDDQGNVRIFKNEKFYGSFNVAIQVKDLAVQENLVFASKDHDIIITDLKITGKKPSFGMKANIVGRGPLALIDDKLIFMSRDGRDIILSVVGAGQRIKELNQAKGAHNMIINAATTVSYDGSALLLTGGWDKVVKEWKIENNLLNINGSCGVDFVINAMIGGESGSVFVGGADGNLVRVDLR